jgi:hypothetical protein
VVTARPGVRRSAAPHLPRPGRAIDDASTRWDLLLAVRLRDQYGGTCEAIRYAIGRRMRPTFSGRRAAVRVAVDHRQVAGSLPSTETPMEDGMADDQVLWGQAMSLVLQGVDPRNGTEERDKSLQDAFDLDRAARICRSDRILACSARRPSARPRRG